MGYPKTKPVLGAGNLRGLIEELQTTFRNLSLDSIPEEMPEIFYRLPMRGTCAVERKWHKLLLGIILHSPA